MGLAVGLLRRGGDMSAGGTVSVAGLRFAMGRVHEALGSTSPSLALALASSTSGPVMWIGEHRRVGRLRAGPLADYLDISRLVTVETATRRETLWATAEALQCAGVGLVVAELSKGPDLFESRHLQVAAKEGQTTGLVLIGERAQSSAAQTRWHCKGASEPDGDWLWRKVKDKQGRLGEWFVRCSRPPDRTVPPDLVPLSLQTPIPHAEEESGHVPIHFAATPRHMVSPAATRPPVPA